VRCPRAETMTASYRRPRSAKARSGPFGMRRQPTGGDCGPPRLAMARSWIENPSDSGSRAGQSTGSRHRRRRRRICWECSRYTMGARRASTLTLNLPPASPVVQTKHRWRCLLNSQEG
jgi:hypothetical protein